MQDMINAGSSSYILKIPPRGLRSNFHISTVVPPAIIPDMAPALVVLSQKSENSIVGSKVASNPAHAKDTTLNMTLFLSFILLMHKHTQWLYYNAEL
ncbi:hypothetical protein JOD02_000692 [Caldicoprobacter guelmensis]|nr:hypothetical protein [Caldicoprobacter guelmensis]